MFRQISGLFFTASPHGHGALVEPRTLVLGGFQEDADADTNTDHPSSFFEEEEEETLWMSNFKRNMLF